MSVHAQQPSFTLAERHGARRLLDLGAFSAPGGDLTRDMYLGFVKRGWAEARLLGDERWLVRLTPLGRQRTTILRNISI